jgi:hypothetical protein
VSQPDVDTTISAVRLRACLEARLREKLLHDRLEAAPLDATKDLSRPSVKWLRRYP